MTGEVDNYEDNLHVIEQATKDEEALREKLDKTNKEVIETGKSLLKSMNKLNVPTLVLEDKDGNKTITTIDEYTNQIVITRLDNKSLTKKDETVDTSTKIGDISPKGLNDFIKLISIVLYVFGSGYLLALAVMNAFNRGYSMLAVDFILWLFITGLMAKIWGYL
jgi:hypothetical protein